MNKICKICWLWYTRKKRESFRSFEARKYCSIECCRSDKEYYKKWAISRKWYYDRVKTKGSSERENFISKTKGKQILHNGGRSIDKRWYVLILSKDHPNRNSQWYVREHILVMETYIWRYLTKDEVVHHIDENTSNNNINNLVLCKNQSEHIKLYHSELWKNRL